MARKWEGIISYEDRGDHLTTSRWRLSGISTKEGSENTDSGVLWLKTARSGDTVTCDLYKDDGCASGNKVATGSADVSGCDNTGENAVEVTLAEANSSGITGSFWIHDYQEDSTCPVQVALCVDEDLDALWDGIEALPGYDSTNGMAEFIRVAGEDVLGKVMAIFRDQLDSYGTQEAWFITDADRTYPDVRRVANPGQLRLACAHHSLEIALGRSHQMGSETMYSALRDHHAEEYRRAMDSLQLAFKTGSGDDVDYGRSASAHRMDRA